MPSPNPRGRPKSVTDRRVRARQKMLEGVESIIEVLQAQALDGDTSAAALILSRVLPALKPLQDRVAFDFDPTAPVPQQIEAVLAAVAAGALAPDSGQTIITALGTLSDARANADLEQRVVMLEARQI